MAEKVPIHWRTLEYTHEPKKREWFIGAVVVAIIILLISVFTGNFLLSVLVLVSFAALAMTANRHPGEHEYEISRSGVREENTFYPFHTIESFWVREGEVENKLVLKSEKTFMPYITIPLGNMDPDHVREYLLDYIDEEVHDTSLIEIFSEWIGL